MWFTTTTAIILIMNITMIVCQGVVFKKKGILECCWMTWTTGEKNQPKKRKKNNLQRVILASERTNAHVKHLLGIKYYKHATLRLTDHFTTTQIELDWFRIVKYVGISIMYEHDHKENDDFSSFILSFHYELNTFILL